VIPLPRKPDLYEEQFHERPKPKYEQTEPSYSTYQDDFEKPKTEFKPANSQSNQQQGMQSMMRLNRFDKNSQKTLDALGKRQQEINTILMNS